MKSSLLLSFVIVMTLSSHAMGNDENSEHSMEQEILRTLDQLAKAHPKEAALDYTQQNSSQKDLETESNSKTSAL